MNDYIEFISKSKRNIQIADHLLTQTYPLVKDPSLFLAVLENISSSFKNSMDSLIFFERENKTIPPFHDSFESKLNLFKLKLMSKHNISQDYLILFLDIKELLNKHKKSPVAFSREDTFVICSEKYDISKLSVPQIKKFINKSKLFYELVNKIVGE